MARSRRTPAMRVGRCSWELSGRKLHRKIKKVTDSEHVEPKQRIDMIVDDPTDNRILECAATSSSDYLVSGDNHLLRVGQYQGCKIVTPTEFLEIQSQLVRER